MANSDQKLAQAAVELAVFGAILIFILGSIIRTAVGNGFSQNENLKAMRIAMLNSWNASVTGMETQIGNSSRNSSSVLFVEDRLSPDLIKYGDLDRSAMISSGSGTFSTMLMYPLSAGEVSANLPIMDVYIDGQYFPFTTAAYFHDEQVQRTNTACGDPTALGQGGCLARQCLRNQREWVEQNVTAAQFSGVVEIYELYEGAKSENYTPEPAPAAVYTEIFNELETVGLITCNSNDCLVASPSMITGVSPNITISPAYSAAWASYSSWFQTEFPEGGRNEEGPTGYGGYTYVGDPDQELSQILNILYGDQNGYKLFYTLVANGTPQFNFVPPSCSSHPCLNRELSSDLVLSNTSGTTTTNANGDLMYDLQRTGGTNTQIEAQIPACTTEPTCYYSNHLADTEVADCMRCNIAWHWAATASIPGANGVYIDGSNNNYPSYDINGSLKEQTIYAMLANPTPGTWSIAYEDYEAGDVDAMWDLNSCGPKPGLQNDSQMFTFTEEGTYLQIKEGKLYNPETGEVVRSVNQKDNVDLIQRMFQLSNNTGRFCAAGNIRQPCVATCPPRVNCGLGAVGPSGSVGNTDTSDLYCHAGSPLNPVEVCVGGTSPADSCFTQANIKLTCMDTGDNMLYIRSRLQDTRGRYWITNASGQLKVQ